MSDFNFPRPVRRFPVQGSNGRSPFRYPGGKAFFVQPLREAIEKSPNPIECYAEPFAGGAGAAIELLASRAVRHIKLNDADPRVYWAWHSMLTRPEDFARRIRDVPLDIETWRDARAIVTQPNQWSDTFELGFATFYLNRTNRSGIIVGAGPIGGYEQRGKWDLGVRFYRSTLAERVLWIGQNADRISLSNQDAIEFLRSFPAEKARRTFFFIDPPYVSAGQRLYLNAMRQNDHKKLAQAIVRKPSLCNWLMTYDDNPLIRDLYRAFVQERLSVHYSLQGKRVQEEIVIRAC